jgi:hypothetical protein
MTPQMNLLLSCPLLIAGGERLTAHDLRAAMAFIRRFPVAIFRSAPGLSPVIAAARVRCFAPLADARPLPRGVLRPQAQRLPCLAPYSPSKGIDCSSKS